jgi:2-polyprenyl-3-methyl-5-hydroxy-6-metoxy-1,4-benzoquinol methylase
MDRRVGDKIQIEGAYQYNAYYHGKKAQRFWHFAKLEEAMKSLEIKPGDNVLEVGCGSGLLSYFIAKNSEVKVTAIDANQAALDFATQQFKLPNLTFTKGLLDELNLKEASYDKIVFLEVIEHITEKQGEEILKSFFKLLKPGGKLVISTPNKASLWPLIEWSLDFFKLVPNLADEQHEFLYKGSILEQKGKNAGFICSNKKQINTFAPWLATINWKLALSVHKFEVKCFKRFGSLLVYTFTKK